jgi:tetratricopeptide (TPR) repeat protein
LAAAEDVDVLFNKAMDHLLRKGYMGDTSPAVRYLQAVLEQEPEHLEALWQLISIQLATLANTRLSGRSTGLLVISPVFDHFEQLARQTDEQAFLHYATAYYASYYKAYERALSEIDKALAAQPQSPRYLMTKGKLLVSYGEQTKQDAQIEKGIGLIHKAKELSKTQPNHYSLPADYDFQLASAISDLSQPRYEEVVKHYLSFLEQSEESVLYAFAWNNVSIAFRELGQCDKAKESAENALKVMEFGNAAKNKRYAEFCLEMQSMGIMEEGQEDGPDLTVLASKVLDTTPETSDSIEGVSLPTATAPPQSRSAQVQVSSQIIELADRIETQIRELRGLSADQTIVKAFASQQAIEKRVLELADELNPPSQIELDRKIFAILGLVPRSFDLAEFLRRISLLSTVSHYDPETSTLYIAESLTGVTQEEIVVSLVVNVVHALQDQHFNLTPYTTKVMGNDDASMARLALVLGDALAVLVDYSLNSKTLTPAQARDVERSFRLGIESQLGENVPEALKQFNVFPAVSGFRFMGSFRKWNTWKDTTKLYSDVPRSTEQIMHPEKYIASRDDPAVVQSQSSPDVLSAPWRSISANVLGEFSLYLVLNRFIGKEKAEGAAQGCDGDRLELFEHPNGNLALFLRAVWDAEQDASEFAVAYSDLIQKKYPGVRLVKVGVDGQVEGRELQWESNDSRIILRVNGTQVEIIEVEKS